MEQLNLFAIPAEKDAEWVFGFFADDLQNVIERNNVPSTILQKQMRNGFLSVFLDYQNVLETASSQSDVGRVLFRIYIKKKVHYFEISTFFIDEGHMLSEQDKKQGFVRINFETEPESFLQYKDILCNALDKAIDSIPKEFDCCHMYNQCSNAGKCITPRKHIALKCSYRRILKSGKVYYDTQKKD